MCAVCVLRCNVCVVVFCLSDLQALGAVSAAVMSSMDSAVLGSSSMFTHNVYKATLRPKVRLCVGVFVVCVCVGGGGGACL